MIGLCGLIVEIATNDLNGFATEMYMGSKFLTQHTTDPTQSDAQIFDKDAT